MDDELSCALCQRRIEPRRDYVFRLDGRVEHVKCPASARKSKGPRGPEPATDPICPACSAPIRSVDSVVKDGADLLHIFCFVQRRPIAGGNVLPAWALVGDDVHALFDATSEIEVGGAIPEPRIVVRGVGRDA